MTRYKAVAVLALGLLLPGCSKQQAEPMPEALRGQLTTAMPRNGASLPSTVKLNDSFAPHHRDLIADIAGGSRHALDTLTRELFHGSLMQTLAKDPPTLFTVPNTIAFREAALVANMVVLQMRSDWAAPAAEEDPDAHYSRVLAAAIKKVNANLQNESVQIALKAQGIDTNGMTIYGKVLEGRAAKNDAGGDDFSRLKKAIETRLTPTPKDIIVE